MIVAKGPDGQPLAHQPIQGELRFPAESGDDSGRFERVTDENGILKVTQMPLGSWSVHGNEGRGYAQTSRQNVDVLSGVTTDVVLQFESVLASSAYGHVEGLSKEPCDEIFRLESYFVERRKGSRRFFIYCDGLFVMGGQEDACEIRIVDTNRQRVSQWFSVAVGDNGSLAPLSWQ